jgi:hypothetical protein
MLLSGDSSDKFNHLVPIVTEMIDSYTN